MRLKIKLIGDTLPTVAKVDFVTYDQSEKKVIANFYGNAQSEIEIHHVPNDVFEEASLGLYSAGKFDLSDYDATLEEIT